MNDPDDIAFLARHLIVRVAGELEIAELLQATTSRLLAEVLSFGDRLAGASADWLDSAFALSDVDPKSQALQLAETLAPCVPSDLQEAIRNALRGRPLPFKPGPPGAHPEHARRLSERLVRELEALPGEGGDAAITLSSFSTFHDEVWAIAAAASPPAGKKWDVGRVTEDVRRLLLRWTKALSDAALKGDNVKSAAAEIEAEMLGPLEERLFVALGLDGAGFALYGVQDLAEFLRGRGSTFRLGQEVHEVLQDDYLIGRETELIVQESTVHTRGGRRALKDSVLRDDSLLALYLARDRYLLHARAALKKRSGAVAQEIERNLKSDNLNFTTSAIWEIKPIRSASLGVVQEFAYRVLFNFYVAWLKDFPTAAGAATGQSRPLRFTCEHLEPGDAKRWPELLDTPVWDIGGRTIFATCLDPLPGIVIYIRFDLPLPALLALSSEINRLLNAKAERLRRAFRTLVDSVVIAVLFVLVALVVAALVYVVVAIGSALLAALAAAVAALAPQLGRLGVEVPRLIEQIKRIVEQLEPLRQNYGLGIRGLPSTGDGRIRLGFTLAPDTPKDAVPCAGASIGPFRFENAPLAVLASMEGLVVVGGVLASALVLESLERAVASPAAA